MKALILAAGVGTRLFGDDDKASPKSLLRFAGKSLMARHIENLTAVGVDEIGLVLGYQEEEIKAEIHAIGATDKVTFFHNPRFCEGSVVSMWTARDLLTAGEGVFFMDADVLYDPEIVERTIEPTGITSFPYDREFEAGDEPVKFMLEKGRPVEFRKVPDEVSYDTVGEWVGFISMTPKFAKAVAKQTEKYAIGGDVYAPYEDAVRDLLLEAEDGIAVGVDITGLPWIEIDFPEDIDRAEKEILPAIAD
ncbi:MAG: NTP transferase domain-containing protein [Alphaproteobacteria bacterium]|nr:NTP transferase domain-containing protein [Alphaproteobacteria bacterium]